MLRERGINEDYSLQILLKAFRLSFPLKALIKLCKEKIGGKKEDAEEEMMSILINKLKIDQ